MKPFAWCAVLVFLTLAGAGCDPPNDPNREEWIALFNGRDLDGWTAKITGRAPGDNAGDTFRVKDSLLTVAYDAYEQFDGQFGHLFYREPFSYYRLVLEYRFVGEQVSGGPGWALRNSGAMLHAQAPESMLAEQDFPISIEVQLLGGTGTGERPTANLCTPGTHVEMEGKLVAQHCINAASDTFHGDQWVRVEIDVFGDSLITHYVAGQPVLSYTHPQIGGEVVSGFDPAVKQDGKRLTQGYIALQSESHPVQFRKVDLLNLSGCTDPHARNYKTYYVRSEAAACVY